MYHEMGQRFFERNIRGALPTKKAVNRSLEKALKRIVLDGKDDPLVFAFNHNGVTLFAEDLTSVDRQYEITEPRLLNGAQTITIFDHFLKANEGNNRLQERKESLEMIRVM